MRLFVAATMSTAAPPPGIAVAPLAPHKLKGLTDSMPLFAVIRDVSGTWLTLSLYPGRVWYSGYDAFVHQGQAGAARPPGSHRGPGSRRTEDDRGRPVLYRHCHQAERCATCA